MDILTDARRTLILVPSDLITGDGVYADLPDDLRAAGLLMNHAQASNAHALSVLRASESQWAEALRRWLADPTPASLTASVAPKKLGRPIPVGCWAATWPRFRWHRYQ